MNSPKTIIAEWKEDRTAGILNSLVLGGVIAAGATIYLKSRSGKPPTLKRTKVPKVKSADAGFDKFFNTTSTDSFSTNTSPFVAKKNKMSSIFGWLMGRGD